MDKPFPAYAGDEPYVFVCYSHEDTGAVYQELAKLYTAGVNIWYDEGISPGNEWPDDLARAIDGANRLLFFVSPSSVASRHCRNEVQYALDHDKPIVSIHLQETDLAGGLKLSLGSTQAILKHAISPEECSRKLTNTLRPAQSTKRAVQELSPHKKRPWRQLTMAALASLVIIIATGTWWNYRTTAPETVQLVASTHPVIAVLPFVNLSNDPEQLFFSDGIAEDLIDGLARYGNLTVKARSSSFSLRESAMNIAEIGKTLGVTHVLEGSTRQAGNRVRVNIQLVRVSDSSTLWSARHEEELKDVFLVQDLITHRILKELRVQFEDTQGQKKHEIDPEAYIAYLQGRFYFARLDFAMAQTFYERALELDTNFADAHARLAQLFINQNIFGLVPIEAVRDQFIHHNRRAVEIDPTHPDGLTGLALAELWFNRDYEKASDELGELYAQFPNNADLIIACNIALRMLGHETEAARLIDRIVELDPLSPMVYMQRASFALQHRSAADTLADIKQGERLGMSLDWVRAELAIHQNDADELADVLGRDAMHWGGAPIGRRIVAGQLFLLQGDPSKARQTGEEILTMQSYTTPVDSIQAAAMKGDSGLVTELLDSGLATGDTGLSLNLRTLPLGPTQLPVLRKYGLDQDSIDQLDLTGLLELKPEPAGLPASI